MCEEFAPLDEATRVRRERGANQKGVDSAGARNPLPFISYFFSSSGFFSVGSIFKFRSKSVC